MSTSKKLALAVLITLVAASAFPFFSRAATPERTPQQTSVDASQVLVDLKSEDLQVRKKAASQVPNMGARAKEAVPALARMLEDKEEQLRQTAARALQQIGPDAKEALPALTRALNGDRAIRSTIISTMAQMGPEGKAAVPALIERLEDANEQVRLSAAAALHTIGAAEKECQATLVKLLNSRLPQVRASAAYQFRAHGPSAKDTVPDLLVVLRDQNTYGYVRVAAAHALGKIDPKNPEVTAALIRALSDKRKGVQKAAAVALASS